MMPSFRHAADENNLDSAAATGNRPVIVAIYNFPKGISEPGLGEFVSNSKAIVVWDAEGGAWISGDLRGKRKNQPSSVPKIMRTIRFWVGEITYLQLACPYDSLSLPYPPTSG